MTEMEEGQVKVGSCDQGHKGAAVGVEGQGEGSEEARVWGEEAVRRAVSVLGCDQNPE